MVSSPGAMNFFHVNQWGHDNFKILCNYFHYFRNGPDFERNGEKEREYDGPPGMDTNGIIIEVSYVLDIN